MKIQEKYKKDINDIYSIINKYIPSLEDWQLSQSVIFENNKKIVCKSLTNENNEKIGNKITVSFEYEWPHIYEFFKFKNSLLLVEHYIENGSKIKECSSISFNDNFLNRSCFYSTEDNNFIYKEKYDLNDNSVDVYTNISRLKSGSCDRLNEILKDFKSFSKNGKKKVRRI